MDFKKYIKKYDKRISLIADLFDKKELKVSFDNLKKKKSSSEELLYFKEKNEEYSGIFIFGFEFFLKELSEQEFKKILGQNSINFKIYKAYHNLRKKQKKVYMSDILNKVKYSNKDSVEVDKILRRALTLAYYLNWNIEKDKKDIEGDRLIEITNGFLLKVKQRYNFDIITSIYENDEVFMFMNGRGKLNIIFKDLDKFTKKDIEKSVFPVIEKVFNIKKISIV